MGKRYFLEKITPWMIEYHMYSKQYPKHMGIVGRLVKLILIDGELIPSIILEIIPSIILEINPYGIGGYDRLQLTAYVMLVEEEFEISVKQGGISC